MKKKGKGWHSDSKGHSRAMIGRQKFVAHAEKYLKRKYPDYEIKRNKKGGWKGDSARHAKAARGIKTGRKRHYNRPYTPSTPNIYKLHPVNNLDYAESLGIPYPEHYTPRKLADLIDKKETQMFYDMGDKKELMKRLDEKFLPELNREQWDRKKTGLTKKYLKQSISKEKAANKSYLAHAKGKGNAFLKEIAKDERHHRKILTKKLNKK